MEAHFHCLNHLTIAPTLKSPKLILWPPLCYRVESIADKRYVEFFFERKDFSPRSHVHIRHTTSGCFVIVRGVSFESKIFLRFIYSCIANV